MEVADFANPLEWGCTHGETHSLRYIRVQADAIRVLDVACNGAIGAGQTACRNAGRG